MRHCIPINTKICYRKKSEVKVYKISQNKKFNITAFISHEVVKFPNRRNLQQNSKLDIVLKFLECLKLIWKELLFGDMNNKIFYHISVCCCMRHYYAHKKILK